MSESPFMVTLYFRGDNLDPELITKCLGVSPTKTLRKGDERTGGQSRTYINRVGIWALQAATTSTALSDHIEELILKVPTLKDARGIYGVDEMFIDVFLCFERTPDSDSYEFTLTEKNLKETANLEVPILFTVSSFEEKN